MKVSLHPVVVVCSAALAACCLAAGRGHLPPSPVRRPPAAAVLQSAGQALTLLRRRTRLAARRAMQALLACLTLPLTAWMAAAGTAPGPVLSLPARESPVLTLPPASGGKPDDRAESAAPPGMAAPPARASPPPGTAVRRTFARFFFSGQRSAPPRTGFRHAAPPLLY